MRAEINKKPWDFRSFENNPYTNVKPKAYAYYNETEMQYLAVTLAVQ